MTAPATADGAPWRNAVLFRMVYRPAHHVDCAIKGRHSAVPDHDDDGSETEVILRASVALHPREAGQGSSIGLVSFDRPILQHVSPVKLALPALISGCPRRLLGVPSTGPNIRIPGWDETPRAAEAHPGQAGEPPRRCRDSPSRPSRRLPDHRTPAMAPPRTQEVQGPAGRGRPARGSARLRQSSYRHVIAECRSTPSNRWRGDDAAAGEPPIDRARLAPGPSWSCVLATAVPAGE